MVINLFYDRDFKPEDIKIRCGDWDITGTVERFAHQDRNAKVITIHPFYIHGAEDNLKLYYDLALVHTTQAFEITAWVNTICLPDSITEDNFSKDDCHTMGWGTINEDEPTSDIQNYMKNVILNRVDNEECNQTLRARDETSDNFKLHSSFICAGGRKGEDVCRGDGGGPLVCQQQGDPEKYVPL